MVTKARKKPMKGLRNGEPFYLPLRTDCQNWVRSSVNELARVELVGPPAVDEFLREEVLLIAGDRGSGKSLSLLRKSARLLINAPSSYATLTPHNPFRNELAPGSIRISKDRVEMMAGYPRWTSYWYLTLLAHFAVLALYKRKAVQAKYRAETMAREFRVEHVEAERAIAQYGRNPNPYRAADFYSQVLHEASGQMESLGRSMEALIAAGPSVDEITAWSAPLEVALNSSLGDKKLTIFADGLDEALGTPNGTPMFSVAHETVSGPSQRPAWESLISIGVNEQDQAAFRASVHHAWLGIQVGYAIAAEMVRKKFMDSANAYGAIRPEAAAAINGTTAWTTRQKADGVLFKALAYESEHLREILHLNVKWCLKQRSAKTLSDAGATSERRLLALFGFSSISHTTVAFHIEQLDDLILRHAFNAPRQVVGLLAKAVEQTSDASSISIDSIAQKVSGALDDEARRVLDDYVSSVSPPWDANLQAHIFKLRANVYSGPEMMEFESKHEAAGFFAMLYSRGLLGTPKWDSHKARHFQTFHTPDGSEHSLPHDAPYTVLHPSLSATIVHRLGAMEQARFYSADFVVGKGLSCWGEIPVQRLVLTYRVNDGWSVTLFTPEGNEISWSNAAKDASHSMLDHESQAEDPAGRLTHEAGAQALLALLATAAKRLETHEVPLNELIRQAADFATFGVEPLRLHGLSLQTWVKTYLAADAKTTPERTLNARLASAQLAIRRGGVKDAPTFSFCRMMKPKDNYQVWQSLDIASVRLDVSLPRRAFGAKEEQAVG